MLDETRLAELEKLCAMATPGPWSALVWIEQPSELVSSSEWDAGMRGAEPDTANAGKVFKYNPDHELLLERISESVRVEISDDVMEEYENGNFDRYTPETVPDNGVEIASKREVNRGYDLVTGDSVFPEYLDLRPGDTRFIAEARTAVPELIAEVRRLRALLDGSSK